MAKKAYVGTWKTTTNYIQSTGTQYIDTGLKATPKTRVVITFELTSVWSQEAIFGTQRDDNLFYMCYVNGSLYFGTSYKDSTNDSIQRNPKIMANTKYTVDFDGANKTLKIKNPHVYNYSFSTNPTQTSMDNLLLMAYTSRSTGNPGGYANMKLYSCQIYEDGTLVRDFIPKQDGNGIVCLYDNVTKRFFYNAGTGEFLAPSSSYARTIKKMYVGINGVARKIKRAYIGVNGVARQFYPEKPYVQLEYIESTGTQYIDTGFKPNNNTRVVFNFSPTNVTSSWSWPFGGRNAYHNADYAIAYTTSKWYSGFGTTDLQPSATITANTKYLIDKNKNVATINGTSYTNSAATFQSDYNLLLLGVSDGTTIQHCKARLYSCQVYDNGTLIRDFVPAKTDWYGWIGLYDKVTNQFFDNAGSGNFVAGPEI